MKGLNNIILGFVFSLLLLNSANAQIFVTNTNDAGAGSLRQAVIDANGIGGETILFDISLDGQTIVLTTGEITITSAVTISGFGKDITISGNGASRIFNFNGLFTATVRYLTFIDGNVNGSNGGAILVGTNANLNVQESQFTNNIASGGGAIANAGGNLVVTNTQFSSNQASISASDDGGALWLEFESLTTIFDANFDNNSALDRGGAIYAEGDIILTGGTFDSNSADNGGAIRITSNSDIAQINDAIFINNSATTDGGGIFATADLTEITGCLFESNTALDDAGAVYAGGFVTDTQILNSSLIANSAVNGAGGLCIGGPAGATVINSTFSGNTVSAGNGGAINNKDGNLTIRNSTLYGNSAVAGGGIQLGASAANFTIANTILSNNTLSDLSTPSDFNDLSSATITSGGGSIVSDATFDAIAVSSDVTSTDPLLQALSAPIGTFLKVHNLPENSPAIDIGENAEALDGSSAELTTDQIGNDRFINSNSFKTGSADATVDAGAIEFEPVPNVLIVTNALDDGPGSLRATINAAAPSDFIVFDPSLDGSTIPLSATGNITITTNLFIDAQNVSITLDGEDSNTIFVIDLNDPDGFVSLRNLHITRGFAQGPGPPSGGGISIISPGQVFVDACTISNSGTFEGFGGGISNDGGNLILQNSTLSGNATLNGGADIYNNGTAVLLNNTIYGTTTFESFLNESGAEVSVLSNTIIWNTGSPDDYAGPLPLSESNNITRNDFGSNVDPMLSPTLADNGGPTPTHAITTISSSAVDAGSNIFAASLFKDQRGFERFYDPTNQISGGTVDIGAFEFSSSPAFITVVNNADNGAGSLRQAILDVTTEGLIEFGADFTINLSTSLAVTESMSILGGNNDIIIDGGGGVKVFDLTTGSGRVIIENLTIQNGNEMTDFGGGIEIGVGFNVTIESCNILSNSANINGGGIYNQGTLAISNTTVDGNSNVISSGVGGIFSSGPLDIRSSTISNNLGFDAGAIHFQPGGAPTLMQLVNSTVSGNTSFSNDAIQITDGFANVGISNSTIYGPQDNIRLESGATLQISHTIVAGIGSNDKITNSAGNIAFNSNNLVEDGTGGETWHLTGDPMLGPLADNGGATFTHLPLAGSPVIDAGDPLFDPSILTPPLDLDQRDHIRIDDGDEDTNFIIDIGSVEVDPFAISNNALDFDGVNDYVDISAVNPSLVGGQANFSIEMWINLEPVYTGTTTGALLAINDEGGSNVNRVILFVTNQGVAGQDNAIGVADIVFPLEISGPVIADNTWHHVAYTRSGVTGTLYVDGNIAGTHTADFIIQANDVWSLGQEFDGISVPSDFLDGQIDEVRIWDDVRSTTEIRNNMHLDLTGAEANLVAYYGFNQGDAEMDNTGLTSLTDATANAFDGTLNNFGLTSTSSNWVASGAQDGLPNKPLDLFITEVSDTEIMLDWTDNSFDEGDFIIERSVSDNANFVQVGMEEGETEFHIDNSVTAGNGYFYRVRARNGVGDSEPSNEKFGSTIAPPGNALRFDGVDDFVDLGNPDFLGASQITVEGWINPAFIPSGPSDETVTLIGKGATGGPGTTTFALVLEGSDAGPELFGLVDTGGSLEVARFNSGNGFNINTSEWTHVAMTWTADNPVILYVNGVQVDASANLSGTLNVVSNSMLLGNSTDVNEVQFDGDMDEVRVWSVARSAGEIAGNRFNTLVGNESGLLAYYRFDQSGVTNFNLPDRSLNNNNGTWMGVGGGVTEPQWIPSNAFDLAPPVEENALDFDGVDDFVDAGNDPAFYGHQNLTVEAWINPEYTNVSAQAVIATTHAFGGPGGGYQMVLFNDGTVSFLYRDNTFTNRVVTSTQSLGAGKWYHLAGVVENAGANSNIYLYINGQLEVSQIGALGVPDYTNASNLFLGSNGDGVAGANPSDRELQGSMDEVRIWNAARSESLINDDMFRTLVGDETGLIAYYDFNVGFPEADNTGITTLPDLTVNGLDGLLNNFMLDGPVSNWVVSGARSPFILNATNVSTSGFTANWEPISQATEVFIDVDDDPAFGSPLISMQSAPAIGSATISTPLSVGIQYYYRLSADLDVSGGPTNVSASSSFMIAPGNALDFDGADDFIDLGNSLNNVFSGVDNTFSIEAWIYPTAIGANGEVILSKSGTSNCAADERQFGLSLKEDGTIRFTYYGDLALTKQRTIGGMTALNLNQWYHVAATYDGSLDSNDGLDRVKLYVNGIPETNVLTANLGAFPIDIPSGPAHLGIGANLNSAGTICVPVDGAFSGAIDEVRIWQTVRTPTEILENSYKSLVGNETGLSAYYSFNEGLPSGNNATVTTLPDQARAVNGTLSGFDLGINNPNLSNWIASEAQSPLLLNATSVSISNFTANWIPVGGAVDILVDVDDDSNFGSPLVSNQSLPTGGAGQVVVSLTEGTSYYYRIRADIGGGAFTPYSESVSFKVTPGNALDFDGVDDNVSINHNTALNPTSGAGWTVEAWVNPKTLTTRQTIAFKGNTAGIGATFDNWHFELRGDVNGILCFIVASPDGQGDQIQSTAGVIAGEWQHVAVSITDMGGAGSSYTFYINGIDAGRTIITDLSPASPMNTAPLELGWAMGILPFDGQMDEVRIWNTFRTESEIQTNMFSTLHGDETGLVAYYRFDQGIPSGNNTSPLIDFAQGGSLNGFDGDLLNFDLSGNISNWIASDAQRPFILNAKSVSTAGFTANWEPINGATMVFLEVDEDPNFGSIEFSNMVATGGTDNISVGLTPGIPYYYRIQADLGTAQFTPWSAGSRFMVQPGNTLDFDGINDFVRQSNPMNLPIGSAPRTVELWFKTDQDLVNDTESALIQYGSGGASQLFGLITSLNAPGRLYFWGQANDLAGTTILLPDTWYHGAVTYDGTDVKLYLNGNLESSSAKTLNTVLNGEGLTIGRRNGGSMWDGQIDEVRIWDFARSQMDIQNDLFSTLIGNEPGLVSYYRFDEGQADGDNTSPPINVLPDLTGSNNGALNMFALNGTSSNWVASQAQTAPPDGDPTNLFITEVSNAQLDLNWSESITNESGFVIERSTGQNLGFSFLDQVGIDVTSYSDVSVTPGNRYFYRVIATNAGGDSNPSNEKFGSTMQPPGNALDFDGVNSQVQIPDNPLLQFGTGDLTIEGWIYPTAVSGMFGHNAIITKHNGAADDGSWLFRLSQNASSGDVPKLSFAITAPSEVNFSNTEVTLNEWHHVAVVIESGTGTFYLDGLADGTFAITENFVSTEDMILSGQVNTTLERFTGQMDEIRIWNDARSEAELQAEQYTQLVGTESNLVAYYRFDQGDAGLDNSNPVVIDLLPDRSVNNNNGTLSGFALTGTTGNWVQSQAQAPPAPTGLMVTELSFGEIDLSWTDNSPNEISFIIERSTGNNANFVQVGIVGADVTTYSDLALAAETGYYYRVLATNGATNSVPTNEKFGSTISPPGNALDFDGDNEVVSFGNVLDNVFAGADKTFAIEAWVFPKSFQTDSQIILSKLADANCGFAERQFIFSINGGKVNFTFHGALDGTQVRAFESTSSLPLNEWSHIAMSYDGTIDTNEGINRITFYVNGLADTNVALGAPVGSWPFDIASGPAQLAIGADVNSSGSICTPGNRSLDASIDEVRIWNTARSQLQIQMYQHIPLVGNESGLVAYYRFDQGSPGGDNTSPAINLLPDRSINNNNGTLDPGFALTGATSNWVASGAPIVASGVIQQDIDALTDLYTDLNGASWTDNTGWLIGDPSSWFGVTVTNNRVTGIALPNNNLSGIITSSFTTLTGLQSLNIAGNEVTSLPDLSGLPNASTTLTFDVSDNRLDFASLESNSTITNKVISPQKTFFTQEDVLSEVSTEVSINRMVGGTANVYKWFKNDVVIAGQTGSTLTFASAQFTDEGTYRAEVTNTIVTNVTLNTANYILKISSLERDRIALNNIFIATDGLNWTNGTGWDSDDLSTRFGVTVVNNRVTALSLPANNLQGNIPIDLKDIGQLATIELQDNELRALPDVTSLTQLTTLNVTGNRLGFGDLVPNAQGNITTFTYVPQRRFGLTTTELLDVNSTTTVSIEISGEGNVYKWFRKPRRTPEEVAGTEVVGATASSYTIEGLNFDNMGIYYVEVTNPGLPDLTIRNRNQNVFAITDIFGTVFLNQTAGVVMDDGDVLIYEILAPGQPFELLSTSALGPSGAYSLEDVVLGDFIVLARPGPTYVEDVLQTYYVSINDWILASTLPLRDLEQGINIDMLVEPEPFNPAEGNARIFGFLESDFPDPVDPEAGLRGQARRRVRRAGVSLNKLVTRRRVLQDELVLVAYTETDDEGNFSFGDIPPGEYLINIQIPGVPMDTTNLIEFVIEENKQNQSFQIEALALPDAIRLELIEETGFYRNYFKNLEVYPNPANDYLTIAYEKLNSASLEVRLIDLTGQTVQTQKIQDGALRELSIDVSKVERGVYLLNVIDINEANLPVATYRVILD